MNDSVKGLVVFAGSSVGGVEQEQCFSLCRTPPIAQLLRLEAIGKIPADHAAAAAAGLRRSMAGPSGMGRFHNDQLV